MRGMLIDDDEPVAGLRHDVGLVHLGAGGAKWPRDQVARRLEALDARVGGRLAHLEGGFRGFGEAERGAATYGHEGARVGPRRRTPPIISAAARNAEWPECRDGGA